LGSDDGSLDRSFGESSGATTERVPIHNAAKHGHSQQRSTEITASHCVPKTNVERFYRFEIVLGFYKGSPKGVRGGRRKACSRVPFDLCFGFSEDLGFDLHVYP